MSRIDDIRDGYRATLRSAIQGKRRPDTVVLSAADLAELLKRIEAEQQVSTPVLAQAAAVAQDAFYPAAPPADDGERR